MIPYARWYYSYFAIPSGVQVTWANHRKSHLFHATVDGSEGLCGAKNLSDEVSYPSVYDPSDDGMTCRHCQGMVRRVERRGGEV